MNYGRFKFDPKPCSLCKFVLQGLIYILELHKDFYVHMYVVYKIVNWPKNHFVPKIIDLKFLNLYIKQMSLKINKMKVTNDLVKIMTHMQKLRHTSYLPKVKRLWVSTNEIAKDQEFDHSTLYTKWQRQKAITLITIYMEANCLHGNKLPTW